MGERRRKAYITAIFNTPDNPIRILHKPNLISQTIGKRLPLSVVVVSRGRRLAHIKDLDDGTAHTLLRRRHVKVGVTSHLHQQEVRILLDHHDGSRRVDARRHAPHHGFLVARLSRDGIIRPAIHGSFRTRVQRLAIGR